MSERSNTEWKIIFYIQVYLGISTTDLADSKKIKNKTIHNNICYTLTTSNSDLGHMTSNAVRIKLPFTL